MLHMLYVYSLTVALQVVCAIDGCEFRIQRPHDEELEDFSGDFGDQSAWNFTKLHDKFVGKNDHTHSFHTNLSHTDKLYGIVGDAAFTFNKVGDKGHIIGVTPYSNKHGNTMTAEQREDNTNIARIRVIVENVFALLKKWECLSCTFYSNSFIDTTID